MLSFNFQSDSLKIEDFEINPINHLILSATGGKINFQNLLLGKSYN